MWRKKVYRKVASDFGLSEKEVEKIYHSFWRFIKESTAVEELREDRVMPEEEFRRKVKAFNLPGLGKFFINYRQYKIKKERIIYVHQKGKTNA